MAFWYGSRQVIDGDLNGADVMVVFFSMLMGAMGLIAVPTSLQAVGQGQAAAFKVFNVINRVPTIDSESEGLFCFLFFLVKPFYFIIDININIEMKKYN